MGPFFERRQSGSQGQASEIRHAQNALVAVRLVENREEGNDVRVLQAHQRQVLLPSARRDFQNDRPSSKRGLGGQIDASQPAAAELGQELKVAECFPHGWIAAQDPGFQGVDALHKDFDLLFPGGKPPDDLIDDNRLVILVA